MQTQCPHCETRFRVTENQIALADGFVRCGACKQVFNIYDDADQASLDNEQQSLLHEDHIDIYADNVSLDITAETDSELHASDDNGAELESTTEYENISAYETGSLDEQPSPDESEPVEPDSSGGGCSQWRLTGQQGV